MLLKALAFFSHVGASKKLVFFFSQGKFLGYATSNIINHWIFSSCLFQLLVYILWLSHLSFYFFKKILILFCISRPKSQPKCSEGSSSTVFLITQNQTGIDLFIILSKKTLWSFYPKQSEKEKKKGKKSTPVIFPR